MKYELHRHLGGSITPDTVFELLKDKGSAYSLEFIKRSMTYMSGEVLTFQNFLNKFSILDDIDWNESAIRKMIKQVVYDIAREKIDYCELKFTLDKYAQDLDWSDNEIVRVIHEIVEEESAKWGVIVKLVLCVKYESNKDRQKKIAALINDAKTADRLVGIDLVGSEVYFDVDFYVDILKDWKKSKKGIEAHVGESAVAENVRLAIEKLGVGRIAHGIKAVDSKDILALAKERDVCFDIALTSNIATGQVSSYEEHPVGKMLHEGCAVTIGTDDPAILNVDLDHEYDMLQKYFNVSDDVLMNIMNNSCKYAFHKL